MKRTILLIIMSYLNFFGYSQIKLVPLEPLKQGLIRVESTNVNAESNTNLSGYALSASDLTTNTKYENQVESKNSKALLWGNLNTWVSNYLKSYKYTVDYEDKETGRLIIKINAPIRSETMSQAINYTEWFYHFTLQIDCKDNKFRYIITNREVSSTCSGGDVHNLSTETLTTIMKEMKSVVNISQEYYSSNTSWPVNNTWTYFFDSKEIDYKNILQNCCNVEKNTLNSLVLNLNKADNW